MRMYIISASQILETRDNKTMSSQEKHGQAPLWYTNVSAF